MPEVAAVESLVEPELKAEVPVAEEAAPEAAAEPEPEEPEVEPATEAALEAASSSSDDDEDDDDLMGSPARVHLGTLPFVDLSPSVDYLGVEVMVKEEPQVAEKAEKGAAADPLSAERQQKLRDALSGE